MAGHKAGSWLVGMVSAENIPWTSEENRHHFYFSSCEESATTDVGATTQSKGDEQ